MARLFQGGVGNVGWGKKILKALAQLEEVGDQLKKLGLIPEPPKPSAPPPFPHELAFGARGG